MWTSHNLSQAPDAFKNIADTFFDLLAPEFLQDEQRLLHHIALRTQQLFKRGEASIFLVSGPPTDKFITYRAGSSTATDGRLSGLRLRRGEGIVGWVIEQGQPRLVADVRTTLAPDGGPIFSPLADRQSTYRTRSLACVPLTLRQQVVGALEIVDQQPDQFSAEDLSLLETAAYFVVILIQQFRHLRATRRRAQLLDARARVISQTMPTFDHLDRLLEKMVESIRLNFGFYYVGLYLVDDPADADETRWARLRVAAGKQPDQVRAMLAEGRRLPVGSSTMIGWTTQHGRPRISLHVDEERIIIRHIEPPSLDPARPKNEVIARSKFLPDTRSSIALPLTAYGSLIGAITIQSEASDYFTEENFSDEDVGTLQALVDQLAFVIHNARLHQQTKGVADKNRLLMEQAARRAKHSAATAQVGANIISILKVDQLLAETVELIHDKFALYYAGIFLIETVEDDGQRWPVAKLRAASGPGGRKLLTKGHQLEVGSNSMVGYATSRGEARIALDVGQEAIRFQHPDLPDARSEMALPLRNRSGIIGALDVQSRQKAAFTPEDIQTLQIMADQLATAIYNAQLYERTEEDRRHLEALRDIDQAIISAELNLEETLHLILEKGLALTEARNGAVLLLENDGRNLRVVMSNRHEEIGRRLPVNDSIPGLAVEQAQTVRIPEVSLAPNASVIYELYGPKTASLLLVPLRENELITGVFTVSTEFSAFQDYHPLADRQQATLEMLAEHAAIAIKNATLFESEQKRARHNEFLRKVAQHVSSTLHLDEIMDTILAELKLVIDYDGASIQLMRADSLEIVQYRGYLETSQVIGQRFPRHGNTPNAIIIETGRSLILADTHHTPFDFETPLTGDIRSWLGVPLLFKGKLLGIISVDSRRSHQFTQEQAELTEAFAAQVASALENANLFEQQKETAQKLLEIETIRSMAEATGQSLHWVANQTAPMLYWVQKLKAVAAPLLQNPAVDDISRADCLAGLEIIEENARLILEAKEGIMGVARPFDRIEVSLVEVIQNVLKDLDLEATGIRVWQAVPASLPPVYVDRLALEEVFRNLFLNARQAMQGVEAACLRLEGRLVKKETFAEIRVSDNGVGIPAAKLKEIWTPFYTTHAGAGGTGIGLSYCLQVIHKMGGEISVKSEVGRGSSFVIQIPVML